MSCTHTCSYVNDVKLNHYQRYDKADELRPIYSYSVKLLIHILISDELCQQKGLPVE